MEAAITAFLWLAAAKGRDDDDDATQGMAEMWVNVRSASRHGDGMAAFDTLSMVETHFHQTAAAEDKP